MNRQQFSWICGLVAMGMLGIPCLSQGQPITEPPPDTVRCANLVYAKNRTSVCFSNLFLQSVNEQTSIATARNFDAVQLGSSKLFEFPFAVMTGEGSFRLSKSERAHLRNYLNLGGFVVASAGCSSRDWAQSFQRELQLTFPQSELKPLAMSHPIFTAFYEIHGLQGGRHRLEGLEIDDKIALVFSRDGLNDSRNVDDDDCCCCGGSELTNARRINVNLLVYALTH